MAKGVPGRDASGGPQATVAPTAHAVAGFLQNEKRATIAELEADSQKQITINADANRVGETYEMVCYNERGSVVKF